MPNLPRPSTYSVYSIHDVLAVCENEDFVESFHEYLCNSDYSYGDNGDTLIGAQDFDSFFHEFCEEFSDVYPKGSINYPAVRKLIVRMRDENDKVPTFVGLGC
jgi:hypothetical protein